VDRKLNHLIKLENKSINLVKTMLGKYPEHTSKVLISGGKDSTVVAHICNKVLKMTRIFSNTSLGCADEYKYIKSLDDVTIISPKEGFYQWRERMEFIPTRFARACCSKFKESSINKVLDHNEKILFFMGMRNEESNTRSGYGDEWKNEKWEGRPWEAIKGFFH
jgi:3'-phosphoadenosine 5'-phosphosulfate sulfotransferase (PAPS reductase)/FAD synthetase